MEWEKEAEEYLKKVPFFVRSKVRKEVEKYLSERGYKKVSLEALLEAKKALLDKMSQAENGYEVSGCFGLNACPNALTKSEKLLKDLEKILEKEKITEFLKNKVKGALKAHHRFKVGLSECPNACSQIYICDFALHGVVRPEVNVKKCSFCGSCVEVCEEEAITLTDFGPVIEEEKCVGCGACIKICPEQAITESFRGYKIYIGGKLGRHPRLATFLTYANEKEVKEIFKKVLKFYKTHNIKGERLGAIIERLGFDKVKKSVLS
jgi:dissimilatory sulfite reductase (desulfoviridin) alpha/beta subunit